MPRSFDDVNAFHWSDPMMHSLRAKTATVLVYKNFDESPVTYDGALTKKDLSKWVNSVAYPPFAILDQCVVWLISSIRPCPVTSVKDSHGPDLMCHAFLLHALLSC